MKTFFKTVLFVIVGLLLFLGCEFGNTNQPSNQSSADVNSGSERVIIQNGTTSTGMYEEKGVDPQDGLFFQNWYDNFANNNITYNNHAGGRFYVDWNTGGSNVVVGKGWCNGPVNQWGSGGQKIGEYTECITKVPATSNKIVHYEGTFIPENDAGYKKQNELNFYGWGNDNSIEYYVMECYGEDKKPKTPDYTKVVVSGKDTYTSDGHTYSCYWKIMTNMPSPRVSGSNDTFLQIKCLRADNNHGTVSGTITLKNHLDFWNEYAKSYSGANSQYVKELTSHNFQIMAVEGFGNVKGKADITVKAGASFYDLKGIALRGGSKYSGNGESRYTANNNNLYIHNVYSSFYISDIDEKNNRVKLEIRQVPVDSLTQRIIDNIQNPIITAPVSAARRAEIFEEGSLYNGVEDNELSYSGWATVTDNGTKIDLGDIYLDGRKLKDFVIAVKKGGISPAGPKDYKLEYSFDYTSDNGVDYYAKGVHFYNNPSLLTHYPSAPPVENAPLPFAIDLGGRQRFKSLWTGRQLTATDTYSNADVKAQPANGGWTSQEWVAEPVPNSTNIIRLRNVWTGKYLHAQSQDENAKAVCYNFQSGWWSEQWIVEQTNALTIRLKNRWTGKYLTVVDQGDYADIILKDLHTDWASQEWDVLW